MAISRNNKIHLAGAFRAIELNAGAALSPGHLVEQYSATQCRKQSTAGGFVERLVAQEDAKQGNTIATAYAAGDVVFINAVAPGSLTQIMLKAGINYTLPMLLFPTGDGTLRSTTGTPKQAVAALVEALDLSASGAVDTLGVVRII